LPPAGFEGAVERDWTRQDRMSLNPPGRIGQFRIWQDR
jgi:hypothetical protein